jgi:hypothetical protein
MLYVAEEYLARLYRSRDVLLTGEKPEEDEDGKRPG